MSLGSIAVPISILMLSLSPMAAAASTAARVYANFVPGNTGTYQGVIQAGLSTQQIALYLENGAVNYANPACHTVGAAGDEICAYDVKISIEGGGYITGFSAATAMQWWPGVFPGPPNEVRSLGVAFVGVNSAVQELPGKIMIGTVTVNGSPPGGTRVVVSGKQVVDAGLRSWPVPTATLATLPEPGAIAGLVGGALALALLHRLRCAHEC